MARSVACLLSAGVTPHDTDLFMSLQLTQPTATENTATQGGKYFNNSDVPTPFRSYSPHSLERRGMNTGMSGLLCDHPLCSGSLERRGPWERFRVSDVLSLPAPSLSLLLMMTPLSALSLSPGRSLFPDLPRTVIKI